jgi:hypothetical protein
MPNLNKLDWTEAQEIADHLLKIDNPESDYDITENALADKWNIDVDSFTEIINGLFQMIDFGISPLTFTVNTGFTTGEKWIGKKESQNKFLQAIILWCTEGDDIPEDHKGFIRTIKSSYGEFQYDITISRPETRSLNFKIKE